MSMDDLEKSVAFREGKLWRCTCPKLYVPVNREKTKFGLRVICTGSCKPLTTSPQYGKIGLSSEVEK